MKMKISKQQWESIGKKAGWITKTKTTKMAQSPIGKPFEAATFTYHINLNERGSFSADVRNSAGKTVFDIKAGNELGPDESSIFEDGFMNNIHDMNGLKQYLVSLKIMQPNQSLKDMDPNER